MQPWYSSELAQKVAINGIAESVMAFNTNYKDTGLFGVYAVAKVSVASFIFEKTLASIVYTIILSVYVVFPYICLEYKSLVIK
jgi:hypothetical protein